MSTEKISRSWRTWLRTKIRAHESQRKIELNAGIAVGYLSKMLKHGHVPGRETVESIARALKACPVEALMIAGYWPIDRAGPTLTLRTARELADHLVRKTAKKVSAVAAAE